jgi:hypothetical protein
MGADLADQSCRPTGVIAGTHPAMAVSTSRTQ